MKNDLNLFQGIPCGKEERHHLSNLNLGIGLALAVSLGMVLLSFGFFWVQNIWVGHQLTSLTRFTEDPANVMLDSTAQKAREELSGLHAYTQLLEESARALESQSIFTPQLYRGVLRCAPGDVTILEYRYSDNQLTLRARAGEPLSPAGFVQALEAADLFTLVEYSGFTGSGAGGYSFTLLCHLKGGEQP